MLQKAFFITELTFIIFFTI